VHELSIAQAIADTAARHADHRPVAEVRVRIGHLRQVVPDALAFAWTLLVEGTALDGARLVVEPVPAVVSCRRCHVHTPLDLPLLVCAGCGGSDVSIESGEELEVRSIDVAEVA
jgi:hydrogenase nickel incorporation protein HypA/HybF